MANSSHLIVPAVACGALLAATENAVPAARALARLLLLILLLTIIVLTGLMVIRSMRWARQRILRRRAEPTDASDVWSMHRLPDEASEESDDNGNGRDRR
jgi:hypothetical protein